MHPSARISRRTCFLAPLALPFATLCASSLLKRERGVSTLPASRSPYHRRSRRPPSAAMSYNSTSPLLTTRESQRAYRGEILCNRTLNMSKIKAIGFDMDYTLAMYNSEQFETLSATCSLQKLVHNLGYPEQLLRVPYDHSYFIRGLVVDKDRGNIIKLDRHKYVKRAQHGFKMLSKEERTQIYDRITTSGGGFTEPRFAMLDAMFAIPDAFLFSSVVQYKDENPDQIPQDYIQIYRDVRKSVDMCHRDGSIKNMVAEDPSQFILRDPTLILMLKKLRRSGRKIFLLTNSLFNYTDTVMSYLCQEDKEGHWIDLFDIIISASAKPAFLLNPQLPLFRCNPDTGYLQNTEGVYGETAEQYLSRGKCFQGGNYTHLHDLLGISNGTQILYVGDHIYSDVLRAKRTLGWRTALIVPELEHEINTLYDEKTEALGQAIRDMRDKRNDLDEWVDRLEGDLVSDENLTADRANEIQQELAIARKELSAARSEIARNLEKYHSLFHPTWGQLFKTGMQNSRFAEQVQSYACLYTSRVTNIGLVSPEMYWRVMNDVMPHDRLSNSPMYHVLSRRATPVPSDEQDS